MTLKRHVITCMLRPTFLPSVDIEAALRNYADARFSVNLYTSGDSLAGEVRFIAGAKNSQALRENLGEAETDQSALVDRTLSDIARVLDCERRVFGGPLWFSVSAGLFEFSRSVDCVDDDLGIARALVTDHYATAFLRTLGNLESVE